jgi:homogentisate 1,2-dioxygenase
MAAAVAAAGDAALEYMTGFGNEFQTEALPGALPALGNTPQVRLTLTPSLDSPCISSLRLIITMTVQLALSLSHRLTPDPTHSPPHPSLQRVAYGLYAEQLSGAPFTAPRGKNLRR